MRAAPRTASLSSPSKPARASLSRRCALTSSSNRSRATGTPSRKSRMSNASSSASPSRRRYAGSSGDRARRWSPVASRAWIRCASYPASRSSRASAPPSCRESARGGAARVELALLLRLEVVLEVDAGVERAVGLLPLVLHVDLGEVAGHLIRRDDVTALESARLVRADQDVVHLDHEELLLSLARLARGERGVLDVLTRGARLHEGDARRVHAHYEVEVLHRDLAAAAAAATTPGRPRGVRLAPAPRLDVDLVLVLGVGALALDA